MATVRTSIVIFKTSMGSTDIIKDFKSKLEEK